MLELFEKFALRHQLWRRPLLVALVLSAAVFFAIVTLASSESLDDWLIPSVLLVLWLLQFYSGLNLFAVVPAKADPKQAWHKRIQRNLYRGCYHLFAWFMMLVTVAWAVTSLQLILAWLRIT
ncbi:MAG: hypothetical protein Q8S94_03350 [Pseudohongiella sp.]|jgi:hypothetical protein|nr:hypothetical protein [Pseudohongiella sp.]